MEKLIEESNMYTLPNGAQIDVDGVIKGINDRDSLKDYYLDIVTGQVAAVPMDGKKFDKKRYFKVPKVSESKKIKWARSYVKDLMNPKDKLSVSLLNALKGKGGGFDKFFKIFEKTDEIYGWGQWEYDYLCGEMEDWFDTLPFDIANEWEWDCDCAICQAENFNQKFGRYPKPAELFEFMKEQKNKLVGE